jgi:phosphatidylglycerol:prolipoprotein diacylglycerol transferase
MFPKLFTIGGFFIPTYGVLVVGGLLAGLWLATRLARREALNEEQVANLAIYCALVGLAGAKLLMFVFDAGYYLDNPGQLFSVSTLLSAGVYHGGFLAALAFAWFYMRAQKMPWRKVMDVLAPGAALGHAIGRLGCFAAGCCWGSRCDKPWAVTFSNPDAHEITGVPLGVALHPAQLYEAAATFVVAAWLWRRALRPHSPGAILGQYLVLYSIARFALEFFRQHDQAPAFGGPFTWTQWIALGLAAAGAALWRTSPASVPPASPPGRS